MTTPWPTNDDNQLTLEFQLTTTTLQTIKRLMENLLDSVPHEMSGQGCDDLDDVTSANGSMW